MRIRGRALDEPGQQYFWKITLTIVAAILGAVLALHLTGVFSSR